MKIRARIHVMESRKVLARDTNKDNKTMTARIPGEDDTSCMLSLPLALLCASINPSPYWKSSSYRRWCFCCYYCCCCFWRIVPRIITHTTGARKYSMRYKYECNRPVHRFIGPLPSLHIYNGRKESFSFIPDHFRASFSVARFRWDAHPYVHVYYVQSTSGCDRIMMNVHQATMSAISVKVLLCDRWRQVAVLELFVFNHSVMNVCSQLK